MRVPIIEKVHEWIDFVWDSCLFTELLNTWILILMCLILNSEDVISTGYMKRGINIIIKYNIVSQLYHIKNIFNTLKKVKKIIFIEIYACKLYWTWHHLMEK